jgi:hypothetical protein
VVGEWRGQCKESSEPRGVYAALGPAGPCNTKLLVFITCLLSPFGKKDTSPGKPNNIVFFFFWLSKPALLGLGKSVRASWLVGAKSI